MKSNNILWLNQVIIISLIVSSVFLAYESNGLTPGTDDINLSKGLGVSQSIVVDHDGTIYVGYGTSNIDPGTGSDVVIERSFDGGKTYSSAAIVSGTYNGIQSGCSIYVDNLGHLNAIWKGGIYPNYWNYSYSVDDGDTFSEQIRLDVGILDHKILDYVVFSTSPISSLR